MKLLAFSKRTALEVLRDPLNLLFGIGFPVILLLLMSAIEANVPVPLFEIRNLAPGIAVFGLSFMTLFSAMVVARDRETAFLQRLYTTPLTAIDYIAGYTLPLLPIAVCQTAICYLIAIPLGLHASIGIFWAVLLMIPAALFFISLGLLFGSILNTKQVGGVCGALLTTLTAWFSGAWFDLSLVGGVFETVADALPFVHASNVEKLALAGTFGDVIPQLAWVLGYAAAASIGAVAAFLLQMRGR